MTFHAFFLWKMTICPKKKKVKMTDQDRVWKTMVRFLSVNSSLLNEKKQLITKKNKMGPVKGYFFSVLYEGGWTTGVFAGEGIFPIQKIWAFWKSQILEVLKPSTLYKSDGFWWFCCDSRKRTKLFLEQQLHLKNSL